MLFLELWQITYRSLQSIQLKELGNNIFTHLISKFSKDSSPMLTCAVVWGNGSDIISQLQLGPQKLLKSDRQTKGLNSM